MSATIFQAMFTKMSGAWVRARCPSGREGREGKERSGRGFFPKDIVPEQKVSGLLRI